MNDSVFIYDPLATDDLSRVRGVGRYLELLKETFPDWKFADVSRFTFHVSPPATFINPFINFLQPPVITTRLAAKQIGIIHDLIPLKYKAHFPTGLRGTWNSFRTIQTLKYYDSFVTDSEASRRDIQEILKIPVAKIAVIYPTLPKSFDKPAANGSQPFCLYVGDVTWNKNLANLARAIKIAGVPCVFVGRAFESLKNVKDMSDNPWLNDFNEFRALAAGDPHFIFPGYVSNNHLLSLYRRARLNLLLSRAEGFGFSFLEAASQGCPSVLSDIPVFQETSADAALYADPTSPEDIAKQINTLYNNRTIWLELQKKAKNRASYFSRATFKDLWISSSISPSQQST